MLYECVGGVMDVVLSVCIVRRGSCRCSCMGVFHHAYVVSCVYPVEVLSAAFSMTCSFVNSG